MSRTPRPGAASWEELLQLDRTSNCMGDVKAFLRRWDGQEPWIHGRPVFTSSRGNRNRHGRPDQPCAWALVPGEKVALDGVRGDWLDALEAGVRELVPAVVRSFSCVTYSSCEGHDYTVLGKPHTCREVCVVARDVEESHRLARSMSSAIAGLELPHAPAVEAELVRECLDSTSDNSVWRGITLRLVRHNGWPWSDYFAQLDTATTAVIGHVERHNPEPL